MRRQEADGLTSPQVQQYVVQILSDHQDALVCGLERLLGELSHVGLQEAVEDVGERFSSLQLQMLLGRKTLLRLALNHLGHLRDKMEAPTC